MVDVPSGTPKHGPFARDLRSYAAFAANDRGIGHNFWLFHGINYLSNYPFLGIYHGEEVYRWEIFSHIWATHMEGNQLSRRGRECLVWASATAPELYRAMVYIKAFSKKYRCDPYLPYIPYVDIAVCALARIMEESTSGWGSTDPLTPTAYYSDFRKYGDGVRKAAKSVLEHDPRSRFGWEFWANLHRDAISRYGLPPGVQPFRLDYRERKSGGYLVGIGDMSGHQTKFRTRRRGRGVEPPAPSTPTSET
jgi:hypothetical protein